MRFLLFLLLSLSLFGCNSENVPQNQFFEASDERFTYTGRTLAAGEGMELITSAASVKAEVYGDTATVFLKSKDGEHHYVAVELNEEYKGRFRIFKDTLKFALPKRDSANTIAVYKETEAANGVLIFSGLRAIEIKKIPEEKRAKIEFIGDSITCGMGADSSEISCDDGEWFDQHTAYMAYGPRIARQLGVDFEINCVSGKGIYRNWNDEEEPALPDVYPYLHLDGNHGKRVVINKEEPPQIVSIALGTNDFSLGDGKKMRMPFNEDSFKDNYIKFLQSIFKQYPNTKVALLSSPMIRESEDKQLFTVLEEIQSALPEYPIEIFDFSQTFTDGCAGHPSAEEHELMAQQLLPFYYKLLNNT